MAAGTGLHRFMGAGRRETNKNGRMATAAGNRSLTAIMGPAWAGAAGHLAFLGRKQHTMGRGGKRQRIYLGLSNQRQGQDADQRGPNQYAAVSHGNFIL